MRRWLLATFLAAAAAGCDSSTKATGDAGADALGEEEPVQGRLLWAGTDIERPRFTSSSSGERWIELDVRRRQSMFGLGGLLDLHRVRWSDGEHRTLLEGRADRAEWPVLTDANLDARYMIDEHTTPAGEAGTLVRIDASSGEKTDPITDVLAYGSGGNHFFYYRRYVMGATLPELHLHHDEGRDRNLGPTDGPVVFSRDPAMYFLSSSGTLSVVQDFDAPVVPLREHVVRFLPGFSLPDAFVVAKVMEEGGTRTVVLNLTNKTERPVPAEPCCWLFLRPPLFTFATAATDTSPATLHELDITTGADNVLMLPPPMTDVARIDQRPSRPDERLLYDSRGHGVVHRPMADPAFVTLPGPLTTPTFSADGRSLLYVETGGALLLLDADDWSAPPRRLSPEGVAVTTFFLTEHPTHPLVFTGTNGSSMFADLYLGDHRTGASNLIAKAILEVTMTGDRLLGIWNARPDLTGELRVRSPDNALDERRLEYGVSDYALDLDRLAFVVRGASATSKRNGLWAVTLPTSK